MGSPPARAGPQILGILPGHERTDSLASRPVRRGSTPDITRTMLLPHLLRTHPSLRTEVPPLLWEATTDETHLVPLVDQVVAAALRSGSPLTALALGLANVVVPEPAAAEEDGAGFTPAPGEYVALTLAGPGSWSTDWSWLPHQAAAPPGMTLPPDLLAAAKVCYAYGRDLAGSSSVTLFLARRAPG